MEIEIKNKILHIANKYNLKERAINSIDNIIDIAIKEDLEVGVDFLEGNNRNELIYKFGRFDFQINEKGDSKIGTRINIYSKRLYGPNFDCPVGYYIEYSNIEGELLDEFINFDWSPISFSIDYYIERIKKRTPLRFYRRNIPEYEFVTYVSHIFFLFQGRQFDIVILFINRCLNYINKPNNLKNDKEYLSECLEFFRDIFYFIKKNKLVDDKKLEAYNIEEIIKQVSY